MAQGIGEEFMFEIKEEYSTDDMVQAYVKGYDFAFRVYNDRINCLPEELKTQVLTELEKTGHETLGYH